MNYREDFNGCLDFDLYGDIWLLVEGDRAADVFVNDSLESGIKVLPGGFIINKEF